MHARWRNGAFGAILEVQMERIRTCSWVGEPTLKLTRFLATLLPLLLLGALAGRSMVTIASLVIGVWLLLRSIPSSIRVTQDGVTARWLVWSRVFVFSDVFSIEYLPDRVRFEMEADGEHHDLPCAPFHAAVHQRIHRAFVDSKERRAPPFQALERQGRPVDDWLRDLRALQIGEVHYRLDAIPRQRLGAIVADGFAPAERRIAAAVVLAPTLDERERRELADFAKETASERLRAGLSAVLHRDDVALRRALA